MDKKNIQIKKGSFNSIEFKKVIDLVLYVFKALDFKDFVVQVSLRDPEKPEKYIGEEENWNQPGQLDDQ